MARTETESDVEKPKTFVQNEDEKVITSKKERKISKQ